MSRPTSRARTLPLAGLLLLACPAAPPGLTAPIAPSARPERRACAAGPESKGEVPRVIADEHGFTPGELALPRGGPGRIAFRRTTDDTCATAVVFPALGIERDLPLGRDVVVAVPTAEAHTFTFQCGMGMYRSRVVVR